jgi:hypothetical protein
VAAAGAVVVVIAVALVAISMRGKSDSSGGSAAADDPGSSAPVGSVSPPVSDPEPEGGGTPAVPEPPAPPPEKPAVATLRKHFQRLGHGDYEGAFALMTPYYRAHNPSWVQLRSEARPVVKLVDVSAEHIGSRTALVSVHFYARDRVQVQGSDTICREFTGTLHVQKVGGAWRYDPGHEPLAKQTVPRSDPHCRA